MNSATNDLEPPSSKSYPKAMVREATLLFAAKSYRGTTMRDIGEALGIHAGSLYVHIDRKEDLLFAIIGQVTQVADRVMEDALMSGAAPLEQLHQIAQGQLDMMRTYREAATVYFHEWRNLDPGHQADVLRHRHAWEAGLRSILKAGKTDGSFRDIDVRMAGIAFASILNWTYQWFDPAGPSTPDEVAESFVDVFVNGIRA